MHSRCGKAESYLNGRILTLGEVAIDKEIHKSRTKKSPGERAEIDTGSSRTTNILKFKKNNHNHLDLNKCKAVNRQIVDSCSAGFYRHRSEISTFITHIFYQPL